MGRTRTGSIRERPSQFFAQVTFTDETGKARKLERRASDRAKAKKLFASMLRELKDQSIKTITGQRVRERRGGIYARVTYIDDNGARRAIEQKAKTRTDAKELIKKLLRDLDDHGSPVLDAAQMSFKDLADYYEQTYLIEAQYVDGRKVAGLRDVYNAKMFLKTLREFFGKMKLRSLRHGDIERFRSTRLKTPTKHKKQRSIASVNRELSLLSRMLNVAQREGWIVKSPFTGGDSLINVADERKRERIITREEEARLLASCAGPRAHLGPIIICALDTGMRRGEMFKLRWADVDFVQGVITIRAFNTKTMRERQVAMTARLARRAGISLRQIYAGRGGALLRDH